MPPSTFRPSAPRRENTDLLLPRVAFGQLLPEPAARWLTAHGTKLKLGQRITHMKNDKNGIEIAGDIFSAAILATAPQHATQLCPELPMSFDFEPIATVYLQFGPKITLAFPLLNLLGKHGQWVVDRSNGLLACVLSGHGEWEALSDERLAASLEAELAFSEKTVWHKVIREKRATFSAQPALLRPDCATSNPRLFLAGDYTWADYPATLEGAVRSGLRAARMALRR